MKTFLYSLLSAKMPLSTSKRSMERKELRNGVLEIKPAHIFY